MELTKKDKQQIADATDVLMHNITANATEYANLYELTFYDTLIEKLKAKREAAEYVHDFSINQKPER